MTRYLNIFVDNRTDQPITGLKMKISSGEIETSDSGKPLSVPPNIKLLAMKFSLAEGADYGMKGKAKFLIGNVEEQRLKLKWNCGGKTSKDKFKISSASERYCGLTPFEEHRGPNYNVTFIIEPTGRGPATSSWSEHEKITTTTGMRDETEPGAGVAH